MKVQLFKVNIAYRNIHMLYCPKTHACTSWSFNSIADNYNRVYAYNTLLNCRYRYFTPDKEDTYIATFELNSPDDFLNYPEFLV